mgnify:CR=1 FL=1|jgi:hypothetical protein
MKITILFIELMLGVSYMLIVNYAISRVSLVKEASKTCQAILASGFLIASAVTLVEASDLIFDTLVYYFRDAKYLSGILYSVLFTFGTIIASLLLMLLSMWIVQVITKEDELVELKNDNYRLAMMHAIILVVITILISTNLASIAAELIPFPSRPF